MGILCLNTVEGLGLRCEPENDLSILRGIFLTKPDFNFVSFTSFATEADWLAAIAAGNIFPILGIKEYEAADVEDNIYESPIGEKTLNYEGMRGMILKVKYDVKSHKILRTYANKNWKMFKFDLNGNVIGTSPDGTKVQGFKIGYFHVSKQMTATADQPAWTLINIQESIVAEWDERGVYCKPTFEPADLNGVLPVVLTCSTVTTFAFTATVSYVDESKLTSAGADTTVPISGLLAANFYVLDQGGLVETVTVSESLVSPGTYTVTGVDITSGSCQVIATAANLYKSTEIALTSA
jgi:hypothetical protein